MPQALQRRNGPLAAGTTGREAVAEIQRRYNVGVTHADEQAAKAAKSCTRTIANAARLLSKELYVKDDHVMLELVQNADDCSYQSGVEPSLQFILFDRGLLVASNEVGFSKANVESICNLGESSKSRSLGAFTGEKGTPWYAGIGFKAVAMIAQATYIDSGGFNFVFDTRPESYSNEPELQWLGLVCPMWVDDLSSKMEGWIKDSLAGVDGIDAAAVLEQLEGFSTCMWLDLKPDCDHQHLAQQLESISPFMLLNLRNLRHMRVLIATPDCCLDRQLSYTEHNGVITITASSTELAGPLRGSTKEAQHHLRRLQRSIQVPEHVSASEEKRKGVTQVELMFALPMEADGVTARPDLKAWLFAFLPVAPYGFRFNIQADFVLPSNREGILEGRLWNKWLRDQLAPAFVAEAMRALSDGTLSCAALLQFLPKPGEVLDPFLGEAATAMLQLLQQEACVLTASGQYSKPDSTLLPDVLLQLQDGQQLISNDCLGLGLPGCGYIHTDLLPAGSSSGRVHAHAVLVELGARCFTADLLVQWLTAPDTEDFLNHVSEAQRSSWLQRLYICLHRLMLQVQGPLSMADGAAWWEQLGRAPILPLHGDAQVSSYGAAVGKCQGRLFLWDKALGAAADLSLFSNTSFNSSGSGRQRSDISSSLDSDLLFVDPEFCTAQPETESVLRHFFSIRHVSMSDLVGVLLQQQGRQQLSQPCQQQQLLFLMRNKQHLQPADWQKLRSQLKLPAAGPEGPKIAAELHFPLSSSALGLVPDELHEDLMLAGVQFLDSSFDQLLSAGSCAVSPDDARSFLTKLGVQELSVQASIESLLLLYQSDDSLRSIRQEQHLRHLRFMASLAAAPAAPALLQQIRSSLRLYRDTQKPDREGPLSAAEQLFAPLPAAADNSITQQLRQAGAQFAHGCYFSASAPGVLMMNFLTSVAGVQAGPNAVVTRLLNLHKDAATVHAAAKALRCKLDSTLAKQLQYTANHRAYLSTAVQHSCKEKILLLSSTGDLLHNSCLQLPPADAATLQIMQDLISAGSSLHLLADCYGPISQDLESKLVLTMLLGLRQANQTTAISSMVGVHTSSRAAGKPVSGDQLLRHLTYLAQHKQILECNSRLCAQVQQSVQLQDTDSKHAAAAELFFPLPSSIPAALQQDVRTAGMRILHSRYADAATSSSSSPAGAQQLHALLQLLSVKTAHTTVIAQHILRLYAADRRPAEMSQQQHLRHLSFFADNAVQLLEGSSSMLQAVQQSVLLLDSARYRRKASELFFSLGPNFAGLQADMDAAGMHFISTNYAASVTGTAQKRLLDLFAALEVRAADELAIAGYIVQLHKGTDASLITEAQRSGHLAFLAGIQERLEPNSSSTGQRSSSGSSLLASVKQHLCLQDTGGTYRPVSSLWLPPSPGLAHLQADLTAAGMHFLPERYTGLPDSSSAGSIQSKRLLKLLELLGVAQPTAKDVACRLIALHESRSRSVTEAQRCGHLAFFAANIHLLRDDRQLLQRLQECLLLLGSSGSHRFAGQLVFPLSSEISNLQDSMDAAGMTFLDSSYTAAAAAGTSSSVGAPSKQGLKPLLYELGVTDPDSDKVAAHVLQLYPQRKASTAGSCECPMSVNQHMAPVQFLCSQWHSLGTGVKQLVCERLQLRMELGCSCLFSTRGSSTTAVYVLPPDHSKLHKMLSTLQLGGALFLSREYSKAFAGLQGGAVWSELARWFRTAFDVLPLDDEAAVSIILSAHSTGKILNMCSRAEIIEQGLYIAAVSHQLLAARLHQRAQGIQAKARQHLKLALHPSSHCSNGASAPGDGAAADDSLLASGGSKYQTASEGLLYWPAEGGHKYSDSSRWQLQEVLLPSEVPYIHPDYASNRQELLDMDWGVYKHELLRFFTQHLGLLTRPLAGSLALQAAVVAGDRWRPLLLLLSDTWSSYDHADKQQLQELLRGMRVEASSGTQLLCQCFLPDQGFPSDLAALLAQLKLPILHLPAGPSWSFLQQLGVSTQLSWETLLKVLQQLAEGKVLTGSDADLAAMRRLYEQVNALSVQKPETAAAVRGCFERQRLVFVRAQVAGGWRGYWVTCKDVMWSGNRRVFPDRTFIMHMYKDLEIFFCRQLGVRSTNVDDLKEALESMSKRPISDDTQGVYLDILKELARSASSLMWLPELLLQPVLLTQVPCAAGQQLQFVSARSASAPYLPDQEQLVELFGQHCNLLAVPSEELPGLQPLLELVKPPLRSLSNSITRSTTQHGTDAVARADERLTGLLQRQPN